MGLRLFRPIPLRPQLFCFCFTGGGGEYKEWANGP